MNYGYDSLNYFTLNLCGESYLQDTLQKPVCEALNQHIIIRYNYEGFSNSDVPEYIKLKLKCAGAAPSIISDSALSAVHGYVQENPRIIDNIMTDALNIGSQMKKQVIDEEVIHTTVTNQNPFA